MAADPYEVLGVSRDADRDTIRKAYRALAREWHPDLRPDDPAAAERFKEVAAAWEVLGDEARRAEHHLRQGDPTHDPRLEEVAAAVERAEAWVRRGVLPQVGARWRGHGAEALTWALAEAALRRPGAVEASAAAHRRGAALGRELVVTLGPGRGGAIGVTRHRRLWEISVHPAVLLDSEVARVDLDGVVLELLVEASLRCLAAGRVAGDPAAPGAVERARARDDQEVDRVRTAWWLWGAVAAVVVALLGFGWLTRG